MEQTPRTEQQSQAQKTLAALRRCGHQLHHNMTGKDVRAEEALACLPEEEQKTLETLLNKCLQAWSK